ncbi:unnamed protein product [Rangifer tarandus platyrhynchus]|uniref:Uncharacterized protein n=1 Tax=Rangifer tarandus platyrhynchus TaxID=3082113 RepID=A0AC59ZQJ3_RANTA
MEGPQEPSPRPGVSRQHPQSAQERGSVRAHPPTHLTGQQEPPLGHSQRGQGPWPQARVEAPCPPLGPTGRLSRGVRLLPTFPPKAPKARRPLPRRAAAAPVTL